MVTARYIEKSILRFCELYAELVQRKFDRAEFESDDFYAFKAFERALQSENRELRNLATFLQAERQATIETITLISTDSLGRTRKTTTAPEQQVAAKRPPPPPVVEKKLPERRSGDARLSRTQLALVAEFQRLYSKKFGTALDIGQFIFDDEYGRAVLYQSLGSDNSELVKAAKHFLDEGGRPKLHRRGTA
jgi:hypothetical protein